MFMVCMIHVNLFTRSIDRASIVPGKEYFFYIGVWTESVGIIGVNLYALITGYVCLYSRWRVARYVELWAQVAFYSMGLLGVGLLLSRYTHLSWEYSWKDLLLMTLLGSTYWYFAAYSALFLVMPFLNKLLRNLRQREYLLLLGGILLVIPIINKWQAPILYRMGYNVTWLAVLYVTGAYVRRFSPLVNTWVAVAICVICTFQPLVSNVFCESVPDWSYCNPLMVLYSCCLFLLFYRVRVKSGVGRRLIMWAAPLSFGVYLIHVHPWTWKMLMQYVPQLNEYLDYPWWISIVGGAVIYMLCTLIDWGRYMLFAVFRVKVLADWLGRSLERWGDWALKQLVTEISEKSGEGQ